MRGLNVHLLMLMVSMIWGGSWAVGRLLALSLPPATGAWMRYVACMIAFYMWFGYKAASGQDVRWLPGSRDSWWRVSVIALFAVMGYQLLFMQGMRFTAAGDASLIITMNPIFTVLLAAPILGQRISRKMIYGLFLSFIGVVVVTGWSPNTDIPLDERLRGDLMIMLAALCWATATNLTRIMLESEGEHGATSTEIVVWYSLVGTILLTPWWLLERLHGVDLGSGNLVDSDLVAPEVNWLQSNDSGLLDLTAASDLVTPAAVLLAIGGGGTIVGVGHTQRKESKRLSTTEKLLFDFGLKAHVRAEGVIDIPGGQSPKRPEWDVKTYSDHRVAMTAMALASLVGATIEGEGCIAATHPSFHQMLMAISF